MYKVGDRVTVTDSGTIGYKKTCIITSVNSSGSHDVSIDGFDFLGYHESQLTPVVELEINDPVSGYNAAAGDYEGVIQHIYDRSYEILIHRSTMAFYGRQFVDKAQVKLIGQKHISANSTTQNNTYTASIPGNYFVNGNHVGQVSLSNVQITSSNELKQLYPTEQKASGCSHEFKVYTGLAKRYDYCTKCDHTKNERGIYD